uniref:SGNH hydrolase-type esterase domain-containing protein n=1 Tax=Lactuca sativa TaxID=4236 RepID=A0A9R1UMP0_LACSA|nr:hypothetical protein LSAT_V11C800429420 [Lactuca sativa]
MVGEGQSSCLGDSFRIMYMQAYSCGGYGGWNSRQALKVVDQVFPKQYNYLYYFGGNDSVFPHPNGLGSHVPLDEYVENMKNIAIHLKVIFYHIYNILVIKILFFIELLLKES